MRKIANKFVFSFDLHYLCPTKMNRLIYHIIAFLVVAVWGTTFVYTKLLLMAGLTAAQIFVLRFIIAYVMLLVYSLTRKHVFPDRELGDDLHDDDEHVADSMYVSAVCRLVDSAVLPFAASARTADSGDGDGCDWRGGGGTERSFCFTPFTLGRYAGLCGLSVLGWER